MTNTRKPAWVGQLIVGVGSIATAFGSMKMEVHTAVHEEFAQAKTELIQVVQHRLDSGLNAIAHRGDTIVLRGMGTVRDSVAHQLASQPRPKTRTETVIVAAPPDLARDSAQDDAIARMNSLAGALIQQMVHDHIEMQSWRTEMRKRGIAPDPGKAPNNGH